MRRLILLALAALAALAALLVWEATQPDDGYPATRWMDPDGTVGE